MARNIAYGLYKVTGAPEENWAKAGDLYVVADALAEEIFKAARVESFERVAAVDPKVIKRCAHPFRGLDGADGYWDFDVPVLPADLRHRRCWYRLRAYGARPWRG